MAKQKRLRLIGLAAKHAYNLTDVRLEMGKRRTLTVGGRNGQGKSNLLGIVEAVIRGAKGIRPHGQIIQDGASEAELIGDFGDLWVRRVFSASGMKLRVEDADGQAVTSPQARLNKLIGLIGFDPVEADEKSDDEQVRIIAELAGVDLAAIEAERKKIYDDRTAVNREIRDLEAEVRAAPVDDPHLPEKELSLADLQAEVERREAVNDQNETTRLALVDEQHELDSIKRSVAEIESQIAKLKKDLVYQKGLLENPTKEIKRLEAAVATLVDEDVDQAKETLLGSEKINRAIRANNKRKADVAKLWAKRDEAAVLTGYLETHDKATLDKIASAGVDIPGLSIRDGSLWLGNEPVRRLGDGARLDFWCRVGVAGAGELPLLTVRRGPLLDEDRLGQIEAFCEQHECYALIERVGDADLVIEAGEIKKGVGDDGE